jgi:hypothetical protein
MYVLVFLIFLLLASIILSLLKIVNSKTKISSPSNWKCIIDDKLPICNYSKKINTYPSCSISSYEFPINSDFEFMRIGSNCNIISGKSAEEVCKNTGYLELIGNKNSEIPNYQTIGAKCKWINNSCKNPSNPECVGVPDCRKKSVICSSQKENNCIKNNNDSNHLCELSNEECIVNNKALCYQPTNNNKSESKNSLSKNSLSSCMAITNKNSNNCDDHSYNSNKKLSNEEQKKICSNSWTFKNDYDRNSDNTGYKCKVTLK